MLGLGVGGLGLGVWCWGRGRGLDRGWDRGWDRGRGRRRGRGFWIQVLLMCSFLFTRVITIQWTVARLVIE